MPEPITAYVLTPHAESGMRRRGVQESVVDEVLRGPEQRVAVRPGREILQARKRFAGKMYLVRVFVDVDRSPAEVVTVDRTSKLEKYWRE